MSVQVGDRVKIDLRVNIEGRRAGVVTWVTGGDRLALVRRPGLPGEVPVAPVHLRHHHMFRVAAPSEVLEFGAGSHASGTIRLWLMECACGARGRYGFRVS